MATKKKTGSSKKKTQAPGKSGAGNAPQKKRVQFVYEAPGANEVAVTGTFCDWQETYPMKKDAGGKWKRMVTLSPGRHEYRFVVDGEWRSDPRSEEQAPNPFGESNSVINV